MVSDACPECEADHIDLQALTYNQVRHNNVAAAPPAAHQQPHACACGAKQCLKSQDSITKNPEP